MKWNIKEGKGAEENVMATEELQEFFQNVDTDGSGVLDREEMKTLLQRLGCPTSGEDYDNIMGSLDRDNSGEVELEEFLDRAMERTEGAVEEPRLKYTASAFCCGGCWNPDFVTPELVEEFNKVCEENKNKKLLDMGLVCRAIYLRVRGQHGPTPHLLVLVEDKGDYYRFDPTEPVSLCTVM